VYCASVLDVLTGCMTCDCEVLTSVVDDGAVLIGNLLPKFRGEVTDSVLGVVEE
jgi:hypothetical protein